MVTASAASVDAVLAEFSPAQVLSVVDADARVNLWTGAIRSGKTVSSLLKWLLFVSRAPRGGELVVIGRTRDTVARNVFGPLQDRALYGALAAHVSYTPGAPTARILGRVVHVLGASDARAETVLRGLTVAGAYVDEATLVAEAFWTQLLGRMSVPGAQLFATTNPDGPAHWMKLQVIDRATELGYRVFQFQLADNTHLSEKYVAEVSAEFTGLWYRRFILGQWVQAAGAIYDMWDPERHVVRAADLPRMTRVLAAGIDYGDTHATRGYLLGLGPDARPGRGGEYRLYVLSEWDGGQAQHGGRGAQITQAARSVSLQRWLETQPEAAWRRPEWVAVDSAAASFRNQLFHDGVPGVRNAHKAVLPGIRNVSSLLATDKLVVVDTCKHLIERLPGYVWDEKATKRGEDAPLKEGDDEVDALRYAVQTTLVDWRDAIPLVLDDDETTE